MPIPLQHKAYPEQIYLARCCQCGNEWDFERFSEPGNCNQCGNHYGNQYSNSQSRNLKLDLRRLANKYKTNMTIWYLNKILALK